MSSSEEENESVPTVDRSKELLFLASELCLYPEILDKSQLPKAKKMKEEALQKVLKKYQSLFGMLLDLKVLLKKINNMKTRLKKKTDINQTGNKKIVMLEWERKMMEALRSDSNPVVKQTPGAMQYGVKRTADEQMCSDIPSSSKLPAADGKAQTSKASHPLPPVKRSCLDEFETDVTRSLDNKQLQRLVLLQQLKTASVQEEYFKEKLKLLNKNTYVPIANIPIAEVDAEGNLIFSNM